LHHSLVFGFLEFDHLTGFDIDQVEVVAVLGWLIARPAAAEIAAFENSLLLQKPDGPIDRGDRDAGVQRAGTSIELLDIRMVGRLGENAGNDPTLPRHLEASFDA
jgi:hypothetical protein